MVGGGGKHPDLLDAARVGAEGITDAVAEGFLVVVLGDGDGQVPGDGGIGEVCRYLARSCIWRGIRGSPERSSRMSGMCLTSMSSLSRPMPRASPLRPCSPAAASTRGWARPHSHTSIQRPSWRMSTWRPRRVYGCALGCWRWGRPG